MIRVGVIGLGRMGQTRIKYINNDNRCQLVAVCDVDSCKLSSFDCQKFSDPYELLQKSKIDVVFLCTFNWMLPELAVFALSKGIYVFSEKPPGKHKDDVEKIINEETKHQGLFVYYGFNHRHHNSIIKAKSIIDGGKIGNILWYRGVYGKCGSPNFEHEWRNQGDKSGGGILLDQGIHIIDLLYYFGFRPHTINSHSLTQFWKMGVDDSNMLLMKSDLQIASIHSLSMQWKHKFRLEIGGTEGIIELEGLITSTNSYGPEICRWYTKDKIYTSELMGNPEVSEVRYIKDNSWEIEHNEFISNVVSGKNMNLFFSKQAYDIMNIISSVYESRNVIHNTQTY